jgi:hypothetical protein
MILPLLLAAASAPPMTALDAERAFIADAQQHGQWTAFRHFAAPDALMFVPQPTNAQSFLKDRKDPPLSVFWWPGRSYLSCDGGVAVNTGPWVREGGKLVGYFTTVWQRQPDGGWKWIYDGGDALKSPRAEGGDIKPVVASCSGRPKIPGSLDRSSAAGHTSAGGKSADSTLYWTWIVGRKGGRTFRAMLWDGKRHRPVVLDNINGE